MRMRLWQDLRYALRTMRRRPGATLAAGLTLALGIGVNTAIFSVVDAVILRPLPFPAPDRLVSLRSDFRGLGIPDVGLSNMEYRELRDHSGVFDDLSFVWPMTGNLTGVNRAERIEALAVGEGYFRVLGTKAILGRTFRAEDVRPGWSDYTVLSYGGWQRLFGGDPKVLGRTVYMDYDAYVILGVTPPDFHHPGTTLQGDVDFWILGGLGSGLFSETPRTARWLPGAIGKLKPGLSVAQAQAKLDAMASSLRGVYASDYPANSIWTPRITPLKTELAASSSRGLQIILGIVGVVLLLCSITAANLMLARSCALQREFAIRTALGAIRADLLRQFLAESLVLALMADLLGTLLAAGVTPLLVRFAPLSLPKVNPVGFNGSVLAFTMLISVVSALLSGMIPAIRATRFGISEALKATGTSTTTGVRAGRLQAALVIGQVAFSLLLMVGAGLLMKSFWNLLKVNPGFNPNGVLVGSVWLPPPTKDAQAVRKYDTNARRGLFFRELLRHARTLPGVEAAAVGAGDSIPLVGWNSTPFGLEDAPVTQGEALRAQMTSISPDFTQVLGLRIIAGRGLRETDDGDLRVALIDQTMADRFWSHRSPLGHRIRLGSATEPQWWTIVGVVTNMKTDAFEAPDAPHVYRSLYQSSGYGATVFLRTSGDPRMLSEPLRREIQSIDADLPVFGVRSLNQVVAGSLAGRRFLLELTGAFVLLALTLSGLGIYGVTAFQVGQRRREIGIRIALGARPWQVLAIVLRHAMILAVCGIAAGAAGSIVFARFLKSLLFGVTATDATTYLAVAAVTLSIVLIASYIPARRATQIDPATTLRAE